MPYPSAFPNELADANPNRPIVMAAVTNVSLPQGDLQPAQFMCRMHCGCSGPAAVALDRIGQQKHLPPAAPVVCLFSAEAPCQLVLASVPTGTASLAQAGKVTYSTFTTSALVVQVL